MGSEPLGPGGWREGFYIRFSSFMISHTLIQLDNQREKPTQKTGHTGAPREFCPDKDGTPPRAGQQGWAPVPWNVTQRPPVPTPEPPKKAAGPQKRAEPSAAPAAWGMSQGRDVTGCPHRTRVWGAASLPVPNSPPDSARSPLPLDNSWELLELLSQEGGPERAAPGVPPCSSSPSAHIAANPAGTPHLPRISLCGGHPETPGMAPSPPGLRAPTREVPGELRELSAAPVPNGSRGEDRKVPGGLPERGPGAGVPAHPAVTVGSGSPLPSQAGGERGRLSPGMGMGVRMRMRMDTPPGASPGASPAARRLRDPALKLSQTRSGWRAGEGGTRDGAAGGDKARVAGLGQPGRGAGAGVTPSGGAEPFATAAAVPRGRSVCSARAPPVAAAGPPRRVPRG